LRLFTMPAREWAIPQRSSQVRILPAADFYPFFFFFFFWGGLLGPCRQETKRASLKEDTIPLFVGHLLPSALGWVNLS
jgi:hypothetical protein